MVGLGISFLCSVDAQQYWLGWVGLGNVLLWNVNIVEGCMNMIIAPNDNWSPGPLVLLYVCGDE